MGFLRGNEPKVGSLTSVLVTPEREELIVFLSYKRQTPRNNGLGRI